jgi:hypothetical protein
MDCARVKPQNISEPSHIIDLVRDTFCLMQLKTSAFQLSIVWITASLLTSCSGPSVNCDDPATPTAEYCGSVTSDASSGAGGTTSHGGTSIIYYRSHTSSYYNSNPARTSVIRSTGGGSSRSGFGSTGSGRSGFG